MQHFLISAVRRELQQSPQAQESSASGSHNTMDNHIAGSPVGDIPAGEADRTMDVDSTVSGSDRNEGASPGETGHWTVTTSPPLIPKPIGEAGRKASGGYNLQEAMELHRVDGKEFKSIRVSIHAYFTGLSC